MPYRGDGDSQKGVFFDFISLKNTLFLIRIFPKREKIISKMTRNQ